MALAFVIFILLVTTAVVTVSAEGTSQNPIITEVYCDTYLSGDTDGEFIRMHNPTESSINIGGWEITDRVGIIKFPRWANINAGSSLYLAYNATAFYDEMLVRADFEHGVNSDPTQNMDKYGWGLRLNDGGDEVILKDDEGRIIDVVIYGNSDYTGAGWIGTPVKGVKPGVILERDINETTGQYEDTNTSADWDDYRVYVVGQSHFPYETFRFYGNVTVFTSPDSSFSVIANAIDNANESIYLNVYQFHNFYLMDHIIDALERGVEVKIMLEGDPVNGIADDERYIANETVTAGGEVRFMINNKSEGIYDRYAFNHAKYALIDNETTIVMSENWKNTGVPTNNTFGNRGWGIIINNPGVTNYFSEVFREDGKPASKDCFPFTHDDPIYGNKYGSPPLDFVPNRTIPTGNYSHPFDSEIISGEFNVSPVLAPDTSLLQTKSIIGMIKGAESSVYVEQLYVKDWGTHAEPKPNPFLEAAINASRRGCEVKILLNPTYSLESNQATIDYVRGIAADEGLNLDAKFIDIEGTGLNKTHNKGVIVNRNKVLISSVNWNEYSPTNNREVGLIIENEDVAGFYTDVFFYGWYDGSLPICPEFEQSEVLYDVSEETGKPDQYYCSYDETRNKVIIIIKESGIYDNVETIDIFNQYFNSVKSHLNIDNAGVKKFNDSTINEFDNFIESLVKNECIGYIIFVGADLPIVKTEENKLYLDHGSINDIYSYVNRTKEVGVNECIDVAISTVIAPQSYSDKEKNSFVKQVFSNFIQYHSNTQLTFNRFNKTILIIEDHEFASESINYNPANLSSYRTIYFYNPIYVINTEFAKVESEMKNKSLILMYHVHGSSNFLGLGLNNKIYVSNQEILDFCNTNGQISLFVDVLSACGQNCLSGTNEEFCCWPQTWLKTGVWTVFDVLGDPYHHKFERWLSKEKIVGKALRKTYHNQDMIYGDILATSAEETENKPPTASFTYAPENPVVNQTIIFDASLAYDPDGNITNYEWEFGDETKATGTIANHSYSSAGNYIVNLAVTDNEGVEDTASKIITVSASPQKGIFDTGPGTYPSISGVHNGTITPSQDIAVNGLYTYPCTGTGGHTEYIKIGNATWNESAHWMGYKSDWHNITFDKTVVLRANETYDYTIHTGSYPQIHHTSALPTASGWINCTEFVDANGRRYTDWIPAIRLE